LDPVHQEHGTYADGWAALTFALMAYRTGDQRWSHAFEISYRLTMKRPRDSEFDQLALVLFYQILKRRGEPPPDIEELPMLAKTVTLYSGGRLVSNNWVAMRALSRSLQAAGPTPEVTELWDRVLGWQLDSGLFNDAPIGEATPVTYHAKFCAMLALVAFLAPETCPIERVKEALRRGLDVLIPLISPTGMLAPYGRSRDTLFGYAAAVTAFRIGAVALGKPEYAEPPQRLLARVRAFQQSDGHVPCVLAGGEAGRADWDVYVNNPDYNAYAAGLLLLTDELVDPAEGGAAPPMPDAIIHAGPLIAVRHKSLYAVFSAEGQSAPYGSPFFCDYRYYGMQPLRLETHGKALWNAMPYQWPGDDRQKLAFQPYGWIPAVDQGYPYCVRVYDQIRIEQRGTEVWIEGRGVPEVYFAVPRWERGLRELLKLPPLQFRSRKMAGVTLVRTLRLNRETGGLRGEVRLEGGADLEVQSWLTGWDRDEDADSGSAK
jgi:hypothetical protein